MTIITPSKWLADLVKESFLSEYEVCVKYNTIDLNVFQKISSNFKKSRNIENKIMLLGVANVWNDRKGYSDFLKLSKSLPDKYVIVLVGLNEKQMQNLRKIL